ncbi:MAG: hypothetical protein WDM92_13860 [Caulobacteraceae bacterium]
MRALRRGEFWIITHPGLMDAVEARSRGLAEATRAAEDYAV